MSANIWALLADQKQEVHEWADDKLNSQYRRQTVKTQVKNRVKKMAISL